MSNHCAAQKLESNEMDNDGPTALGVGFGKPRNEHVHASSRVGFLSLQSVSRSGIHFIVLENVPNPAAMIGEPQLEWLKIDLAKLDKYASIVIFTHRSVLTSSHRRIWKAPSLSKSRQQLTPLSLTPGSTNGSPFRESSLLNSAESGNSEVT
jgi:hypothetical protein